MERYFYENSRIIHMTGPHSCSHGPIGSQFEEGGAGTGTVWRGWECLERPGAKDDAVPDLSGIVGGGRLDIELPALTDTGEDQLQTGSDAERQ